MISVIHSFHIPFDRRRLLHSLLLGAGGIIPGSIHAEALTLTPRETEGPYYPDHLPLDQDNDLIRVKGDQDFAAGIITNFGGRLLGVDGRSVGGATVELWQADDNGCYIHSRGSEHGKTRDAHFQGFGKSETNAKGEYRFRTVKPGLYTGRTRRYHIAVVQNGRRVLTTQLFLAGEPRNDRDSVLNGIRDEMERLSVIREFKPVSADSRELVATWDIVIGKTPKGDEAGVPRRPPSQETSDRTLLDAMRDLFPF